MRNYSFLEAEIFGRYILNISKKEKNWDITSGILASPLTGIMNDTFEEKKCDCGKSEKPLYFFLEDGKLKIKCKECYFKE